MADTLKEYLITLGFKVNDQQYRKFLTPIEDSTKGVIGLGAAMFATAGAIYLAVSRISNQYEKLYYASQRTGQSVEFLQSYAFAAQQIGLTADEAASSVEAMAHAIRMNPGLRGLAAGASTPAQLVAKLKAQFGEAGYFVAARFGSMFGIPEKTFLHIWQNMERLRREEEQFAQRQKLMGVDATKAAEKFVDFGRAVNSLNASIGILTTRFALNWLPTVQSGVGQLDQFVQWMGKVDQATGGWATTIGVLLLPGLAKMLLSLRNIRGMLALITSLPFMAAVALMGAKGDTDHSLRSALRGILGIEETPEDKAAPAPWEKGGSFEGAKEKLKQKLMTPAPGTAPAGSSAVPGEGGIFGGMGFKPMGWEPGKQSAIINQSNSFNISGGDSEGIARRTAELVSRANADLVRNFQSAVT